MKGVYFMGRIKHTVDGKWDKGIEIKEAEAETQEKADDKARDMAYQSFYAYLGAYAYGKDANVDYIHVNVKNLAGLEIDAKTWGEISGEETEEVVEDVV